MKSIIIFFQHINREYKACEAIRDALLELDASLSVRLFSIDFEWNDARAWARKKGIDAIILPWMRLDFHQGLIEPFYKINNQVLVFDLDQEQIGCAADMESLLLPRCEYAKNGVIHLVWSSFYAEQLKAVGVCESNIRIVGNVRMDLATSSTITKDNLSESFALARDKKWILFAENRSFAKNPDENFIKEMIKSGMSRKTVEDEYIYLRESLEAFSRQQFEIEDSFFEKYELIYRSHPGQKCNIALNQHTRVISEYPIGDWLNNVDIFVTFNSSSVFEAEIVGLPSFIHCPTKIDDRFMTYGLCEYPVIDRITDIDTILQQPSLLNSDKKIYEYYMGEVDGRAAARIAAEVLSEQELRRAKSIPPAAYNKVIRRKVLFERMTKLFAKTNLIKKVKYPRSAYREYDDIPYIQ